MTINNLTLTNFRSHKHLKLEFSSEINFIYGRNGAGKTNVLEAINLLATTKSFRSRYDRDLINYNQLFAKAEATISSENDTDDIEIQIIKTERSENTSIKKVKINGMPKSLNSFSTYLNTVLFSPEDIDVVTGTPSLRRRFMDMVLIQADEKYKKLYSDYLKTIKRRNKLLEIIGESQKGHDQLPFWNNKMLEYGEYLQIKREELFEFLNVYIKGLREKNIEGVNDLELRYKKNELSTKRLFEYREREFYAKTTLIGPHRDDFIMLQNGMDIAQFGSRGEQRTFMFLLKLAEIDFIKNKTDVNPVLLLDDIFSELDNTHRQMIIKLISNQQTFITSASEEEPADIHVDKKIHLK